MTEPHDHEHGIQHAAADGITHHHGPSHGGRSAAALISEEEYRQYQRSDLGAGKVVVALMAGIFTVGLLLYATILIIVAV
jgi:hypothetical protein